MADLSATPAAERVHIAFFGGATPASPASSTP